MNESVRRVFMTTGDPVTIEGNVYPALESVRIQLDHA